MLFAQPGFGKEKKTKFSTMLRLEESYQDNLFLSEENPESGFTTTAIPGIYMLYATGRTKVDLEYKAHMIYYSYATGQEETSGDKSYDIYHQGNLSFESDMWSSNHKGLTLSLDERYYDNQTISLLSDSSEPLQDNQNTYFTNTLTPGIVLKLSRKFKIIAEYENEIVRFKSSSGNDSTQHVYGFGMEHIRSQRNFFTLGYRQTQKDFSQSTGFSVKEGELGFRRILNRTWLGGIVLSYQMRDYGKDTNTANWSGLTTKIFLKAVREKKLDIELVYQRKPNYFDSSVFYMIDRWDLKNKWTPTKKVLLFISPYYQTDSYDVPHGRLDSLWGIASSFAYRVGKRISLGLEYGHSERNSSEKDFSYTNNVYNLFLSIDKL